MSTWRRFPVVYEINAWVWLETISQRLGRRVTLETVPKEEVDRIFARGVDAVWLMGVWERSPLGRQVALEHPGLQGEYHRALPDFGPGDVAGSPYCIRDYRVDETLGGAQGLAAIRAQLASLGLLLILDFVPNHLALDHEWITAHPERFVPGTAEDLAQAPGNYFRSTAGHILAHGRDPYFPGWTDTAQIDYRRAETRSAMTGTLLALAQQCDGVRCDMAMLVTREIFRRTWGGDFTPTGEEFWPAAIARVKQFNPNFLLTAEVYWDMEFALQEMGFDATYDKRLYDHLLGDHAGAVRDHLHGEAGFQRRLTRFIENHDEPRAAQAFGEERSRAAAVVALTLPGMRLVHEGQCEGRKIKLPVQLGREPLEPVDPELERFYQRLLTALRDPVFHEGDWRPLDPRPAWEGNPSHDGFVAFRWTQGTERRLVVVNLRASTGQCYLPLEIEKMDGFTWRFRDLLGEAIYLRGGHDLEQRGLFLEMPPHGYHLFRVEALASTELRKT